MTFPRQFLFKFFGSSLLMSSPSCHHLIRMLWFFNFLSSKKVNFVNWMQCKTFTIVYTEEPMVLSIKCRLTDSTRLCHEIERRPWWYSNTCFFSHLGPRGLHFLATASKKNLTALTKRLCLLVFYLSISYSVLHSLFASVRTRVLWSVL